MSYPTLMLPWESSLVKSALSRALLNEEMSAYKFSAYTTQDHKNAVSDLLDLLGFNFHGMRPKTPFGTVPTVVLTSQQQDSLQLNSIDLKLQLSGHYYYLHFVQQHRSNL
ncbi:hypothetical protein TNCT_673861 [Trichonephila clavata]|uniref:Uncharacterized protein n=1 Tax=Trichonephila clavata TaxID=2740835 RepID=A0A8X6LG17_TRICU|nr:hypothetical protein TNCT_673861 [Trichonephila clavata]